MNNFDIVNLDYKDIKILIVMKTSDSPFDFVNELQEKLKMIGFSGLFVIDELLHSGNNGERFISGFFDGNSFDNSKFRFEDVAKKSDIRSYMCNYLKSDLEALSYSNLTDKQQKLISHGCVI
ncbi:hypothetical protein D3Z60_25940 [Lachnospiraceae bacterium]|jgi:hypothetical protein|nr:hypothetical protein [Lachnospiraceae bacterium]